MSKFINPLNERDFVLWQAEKMDQGMNASSINQYRSAVYTLEDMTQGELIETITTEQLQLAFEANSCKEKHMQSYIKDLFVNGKKINGAVIAKCFCGIDRKIIEKLLTGL